MTEQEIDILKKFISESKRFTLSKTGSKRTPSMVFVGNAASGPALVGEFNNGQAYLSVGRSFTNFIRTSPLVKIVDQTEKEIVLETEGGFYKLTKEEK